MQSCFLPREMLRTKHVKHLSKVTKALNTSGRDGLWKTKTNLGMHFPLPWQAYSCTEEGDVSSKWLAPRSANKVKQWCVPAPTLVSTLFNFKLFRRQTWHARESLYLSVHTWDESLCNTAHPHSSPKTGWVMFAKDFVSYLCGHADTYILYILSRTRLVESGYTL